MAIDGCAASFAELAGTLLPRYMVDMRSALERSMPLAEFCMAGVGVRSILKGLHKTEDFADCYVLTKGHRPFYVGISRGVVARLRQHGTGRSHFDASLAYRMALERAPHKLTRSAAMKHSPFRDAFDQAKRLLMGSYVAFIEIPNPLELYLFEAYCAMALDTCKWNTFRTH